MESYSTKKKRSDSDESSYRDSSLDKSLLNENTTLLGMSPMKSVGRRDTTGYSKQKVKKFNENIADLMASACDIENVTLLSDTAKDCSNCKYLDRLIFNLKEKIKSSLKQEKIKILTLAPDSRTIQKTCDEFSVTEHLIRRARKLKLESRILAEPEYKRHLISDETRNIGRDFYVLDEFSRLCPGKKIVFLFL